MEKKEPSEQAFTVLQDKPLENGESDSFGHGEIANSVVEVIRKAPRPFNIGIYGQWGVGKSTICKIIEDRLLKEEAYKVVYFDTWKYERDSFRRQFLMTLDEDLKLGLDFKNRLNQSLTETDPTLGEIKFDKRLLFNQIGIIALIIIGVGLLGLATNFFYDLSSAYDLLLSVITSLGLATYVLQLAVNAISRVQISITKNKTDSAEGFEEHFAEVLAEIQDKDLLVIIDNLDRLSSEKAVSLLSDIKTFLSDEKYSFNNNKIKNKTVFVIPCDNKAINDQLLKEYGEEFDTEEYLRKFFNHSIQIPKFLNIELDDFIVGKLNTTQIPEFKDNYDLVFILSYAFRNNPREIIQFINSLISLYLLAKERKIDRVIETEHVAFLAKVLVLRVKWPRRYDTIEDRILRTGDKLSEIVSRLRGDEDTAETTKLDDFLRVTSHISDDEYQDIYFSLRQSDAQKTIPEWNSFVISLLEGRGSDAIKIYSTVKSVNRLAQLGQLLAEYCRRNMQNENLLFNIFITVHKIIDPDDIKYFQEVFLLTIKTAGSAKFSSAIERIDLSRLFSKGLEGVSSANKKDFSQNLIAMIRNIASVDGIEREKIKDVRRLFDIVNSDENRDNFKARNNEIIEAKKDLIGHLKFQELFPDIERADKFRKDILDDILAILTTLGPTNSKHYAVGLTLFSNLLQWPPIIENNNARFEVLEKSLEFLEKSNPPSSDDGTVGTILNAFTTKISTWFSNNKTPQERSLCIKIFQKIDLDININKESTPSINRYITETSNTSDIVLETLGKDFLIDNDNARKGLINRSRITLDLLSKLPLKKKLTDEEKADILAHLVGNANEALTFLEYVGYNIPSERGADLNFLKGIVQNMINAGAFSDTDLLTKWLTAIAKLGVQSDQVDSFVQKLRQVRSLSEQHKQVVADFVSKNSKDFGDLVVKEFQV